MLGMLKAAEEQRKAAQIAWGKKKGHLSKGFQTPKSEKIKYADEEKQQAAELEDELVSV